VLRKPGSELFSVDPSVLPFLGIRFIGSCELQLLLHLVQEFKICWRQCFFWQVHELEVPAGIDGLEVRPTFQVVIQTL